MLSTSGSAVFNCASRSSTASRPRSSSSSRTGTSRAGVAFDRSRLRLELSDTLLEVASVSVEALRLHEHPRDFRVSRFDLALDLGHHSLDLSGRKPVIEIEAESDENITR